MATVTLKGAPVHTVGTLPEVGKRAPAFALVDQALKERTLSEFAGKCKLIATVPSLDTPVCSLSAKKFNEAAKQKQDLVVIFVSADLPFAQKRVCAAEQLDAIVPLSLVRGSRFGADYGVLVQDGPLQGLLARAVFVLDADDKVIYRELVSEITQEPDYKAALASL